MKKLLFILAALAFAACGDDTDERATTNNVPEQGNGQQTEQPSDNPDNESGFPEEEGFEAFANRIVGAVWAVSDYDVHLPDGEVLKSAASQEDGGLSVNFMMLMPDGKVRTFLYFCDPTLPSQCYIEDWIWSIDAESESIELYDTARDIRSALELVSYRNGDFVMRGSQPAAMADGIYYTIYGRLCIDPEVIDEYLAYELFDPEQHDPCIFTISGRVTDVDGNPIPNIMVKNDMSASLVQITDNNGEYTCKMAYPESPWEEGTTPCITLTFEEYLFDKAGYKPQTVKFEFTDEYRVTDPASDEDFIRTDADVVLTK